MADEPITPALQMRGIVKRFPGVVANDQVNLEVRTGEIHALLGENGAGKSTLMNVLCGLYRPDTGEIYLSSSGGNGHLQRVEINSPRDAIELGIGRVHQHFMLVPTQTVAENVIPTRGLDVGATKSVRRTLLEQRARGQLFCLSRKIWTNCWLSATASP
jgi:ABC-type uncharacterized transport system ATPase subunit